MGRPLGFSARSPPPHLSPWRRPAGRRSGRCRSTPAGVAKGLSGKAAALPRLSVTAWLCLTARLSCPRLPVPHRPALLHRRPQLSTPGSASSPPSRGYPAPCPSARGARTAARRAGRTSGLMRGVVAPGLVLPVLPGPRSPPSRGRSSLRGAGAEPPQRARRAPPRGPTAGGVASLHWGRGERGE